MRRCIFVLLLLAVFALTFTLNSCGGNSAGSLIPVSTNPGNPPSPNPGSSPTPTPAPSPSPSPSPASTVLDNVEDTPNWLTCGNCGNSGASGPTANYSFSAGIASPSEDGASTQFSIAATVPYTNAYFYLEHTPVTNRINALTYEFDLYIPPGMENAPQAIEFECQQIFQGWVYNFGWQALYPGSIWRIFDYGLKRWDATPISFTGFTPGTWHHLLAEYHNDTSTHTVFHDALTVDGVRFPVNITHNAFNAGGQDQFTNAVQMDSNSPAAPYSVYVDRMRITYR